MTHRRWALLLVTGAAVVGVGVRWQPTSLAYLAAAPQESRQEGRMRLVLAHDNTAFPLIGRHRTVECGACHVNGVLGGTPVSCEACHWDRRQDDAFSLQLGTRCDDCHTPQNWGRILPGAWEHERVTGFRLEGRHDSLDCTECHVSRNLRSTTAECVQCHLDEFQRSSAIDHRAANFSTDCQLCHLSASRWSGARFDHSLFPFAGPHRAISCESCHPNGQFVGTGSQCIDCHRLDFERAVDPIHNQGGFSTECTECHDVNSVDWDAALFDHDVLYALRGTHLTTECAECHQNGLFIGTPTECVDCHRLDYNQATSPNHLQAGFPIDCASCHGSTASSWQTGSFDHDSVFLLRGMHRAAACEGCHANGRFQGTSSACLACHREDYERATNPNHAAAGFSTDCVACHGEQATGWVGASTDHRSFALRGRHATADCAQCHANGRYGGTPSGCINCHRADYDRTASPNHAAAGFSTDCVACHGEQATGWVGASTDHRSFALRGRHATADCAQCHANGRYTGTPSGCINCHRADYDRTTSPSHVTAGFSTDCVACHGEQATGWAGASFDHNRFFTLRGRHSTAECTQCHVNGRYAGTPSTCINCHRTDYDRTTSPNHATAGFSTDCVACHGNQATGWAGASFDHNQIFALRGRHANAECTQCHVNGRYAGTPSNCIDCHRSDYDRTASPNHAAAGFGTDCVACHGNGASSWLGASFNHYSVFRLEGAHRTLDCQTCHAAGYNLPRDCNGCHSADYDATRNPNHRQAGFPRTCDNCHYPTHSSWGQAVFQHAFPINSGKHSNFSCSDCHNAGSMQVFSCIDCHTHSQSRMDDKHSEMGGYTYSSLACYSCHPNGRS